MRLLSYLFCLILIVLGVGFSVLNSTVVSVNYFFGQQNIYFPLLALVLLFVGVLVGVIFMIPAIIKLKMAARDNRS